MKAVAAILLTLVGCLFCAGCGSSAPAETAGETQATATDMGRGLKPARGAPALSQPAGVPVDFEPAEMAFGILPPGGAAQGTSRLWNVGAKPLRIVRSITSCGCTAAEDLAGRVIEPGGYTEFTTVMNMKAGLGEKKEKITIFFDDGSWVAQFYTAEVAFPVRIVPPYLSASRRTREGWVQTLSGVVEVTADDGRPFRIIAAHGAPPEFIGYDPGVDPPRTSYRLRWDLARFGEEIPWYWVLETDRPDCPVIDARIQHSSTLPPNPPGRPWVSKQHRVLLGEIRNGTPVEVSASLEYHGGRTAEADRAGVMESSEALDAELLETQVDGSYLHYRVRLTPRDAPPGLFYEHVTLYASGYSTQLRVIGRVAE